MSSKSRIAALAGLFCLSFSVHALDCPVGTSPVKVSGRVATFNVSTSKQVGQICVVLTTADGREVFEDCGALVGKIVAMDVATGTTTINHTAVFDFFDSFRTVGDVVQATAVTQADTNGAPCAMDVIEHMTNLQSGTGRFAGALLDVFATGSISFCPGKNFNSFDLSGQGCVRNRHHR